MGSALPISIAALADDGEATLDLSGGRFDDRQLIALLGQVRHPQRIVSLRLIGCNDLRGAFLSALPDLLPTVATLDLHMNARFDAMAAQHLVRFPALRSLKLSGCENVDDQALAALAAASIERFRRAHPHCELGVGPSVRRAAE